MLLVLALAVVAIVLAMPIAFRRAAHWRAERPAGAPPFGELVEPRDRDLPQQRHDDDSGGADREQHRPPP